MATAKKPRMGQWIDSIFESVGDYVRLETTDGVIREGRLTGLRTRHVQMNGRRQELIDELELNGDPTDLVNMKTLARIDLGE